MAGGRMSALSLPIGSHSGAEFRAYARRTPVFTFSAGRVLVSLTLPERLRAEHVQFARSLAEQAAAYAIEVERLYRNGGTVGRAA
jgi:hypothetical protein